MDICRQSVQCNKSMNNLQLFVFLAIAVFGIIFGLLFLIYYTLFTQSSVLIIVSLLVTLFGVGSTIYVEGKFRQEERSTA